MASGLRATLSFKLSATNASLVFLRLASPCVCGAVESQSVSLPVTRKRCLSRGSSSGGRTHERFVSVCLLGDRRNEGDKCRGSLHRRLALPREPSLCVACPAWADPSASWLPASSATSSAAVTPVAPSSTNPATNSPLNAPSSKSALRQTNRSLTPRFRRQLK